jgi:dihydrofolate reductase
MTNIPIISFIFAASTNNIMGKDNQLPWHLPDDFAFFKKNTLNKPIIMGKKTWDSINQALPKRSNIILSRTMTIPPKGTFLFSSLDSALQAFNDVSEIMIIGGAEIFKCALAQVNRIYLTRIHATIEGDIIIPDIDFSKFQLTFEQDHPADERHQYAFTFQIWDKI